MTHRESFSATDCDITPDEARLSSVHDSTDEFSRKQTIDLAVS